MAQPTYISLSSFELIDGLLGRVLAFGPFETCAEPREYIRVSNRLLDACGDVMGRAYVNSFASAEECAAAIVAKGLIERDFVVDDCELGDDWSGIDRNVSGEMA